MTKKLKNCFAFPTFKGYWDCNEIVAIKQEFGPKGKHRLITCDGLASEWFEYKEISILCITNIGIFRGTTEYYKKDLPRVFRQGNYLEIS